jgi:hypothetical protein
MHFEFERVNKMYYFFIPLYGIDWQNQTCGSTTGLGGLILGVGKDMDLTWHLSHPK